MKSAYLAGGGYLEANIDVTNAQKPHPFIHIIVPAGTNGIGNGFFIAADRSGFGGDRRAATIGNIPMNHGLACFCLVSFG